MAAHKPITPGTRFNLLTVLGPAPGIYGCHFVFCRCDCGAEKAIKAAAVRCGDIKSCGCMARDPVVRKSLKHGMCRRPEYKVYTAMKQRCVNPKNASFANYGGRGITVCDRWLASFENFIEDMGRRPVGGTLERINNDAGYSPENCRWASRRAQSINRRVAVVVDMNGTMMPLADAAITLALNYSTAYYRIRHGIPLTGFDDPLPKRCVAE